MLYPVGVDCLECSPIKKKVSYSLLSWMETWLVSVLSFFNPSFVTDVPSLAAIYTLIYTFLVQKSLTKTAQALKKEVKGVVVLKDGVKPEGPSLVDILHEWRMQQSKQASCVHLTFPGCSY